MPVSAYGDVFVEQNLVSSRKAFSTMRMIVCSMLLLISNFVSASEDFRLAESILTDLGEIPIPQRYDCTFSYQRLIKALPKEEVEKEQTIRSLEEAYSKEAKLRGTENGFVKSLAEALDSQRAKLARDDYLIQKQRVRVDSTQARYEVLKDFGSPNDSEFAEEAEAKRNQRSGKYFLLGGGESSAVIAGSEIHFLPVGFYYPDIRHFVRPTFHRDIDKIIGNESTHYQIERNSDGTSFDIKFELPNETVIEIAVDISDGTRLLHEKEVTSTGQIYEKNLSEYRKFEQYWIPARIEVIQDRTKEIIQIESLEVEKNIESHVFDYREELKPDMTVVDARVNPPLQYRLDENRIGDFDLDSLLVKRGDSSGEKNKQELNKNTEISENTQSPQSVQNIDNNDMDSQPKKSEIKIICIIGTLSILIIAIRYRRKM